VNPPSKKLSNEAISQIFFIPLRLIVATHSCLTEVEDFSIQPSEQKNVQGMLSLLSTVRTCLKWLFGGTRNANLSSIDYTNCIFEISVLKETKSVFYSFEFFISGPSYFIFERRSHSNYYAFQDLSDGSFMYSKNCTLQGQRWIMGKPE
jgi:hypothetical protein